MAGAIYHPQNLRFLKYPYLTIQTIVLTSYSYIKPNQCWISEIVTDVYVLKISHNPGQNLLRQNLKIQYVQETTPFFNCKFSPSPTKINVESGQVFSESPKLFKKHLGILGKRGFFTKKEIFYFAATDLSKIVGYGHRCKKYVFDICLYRASLDFDFYYFLALKFIENLHKL